MKSDTAALASARLPGDDRARYIMIGGFLGAGKTTAVTRLAEHLVESGSKVGLITNDHGRQLVDTALLRSSGFQTEEVLDGCFGCRFDSLTRAIETLSASERPNVFVAEAVGSCVDLAATVSNPLRRFYGKEFRIAPLSVVVDPGLAAQMLGIERGRKFPEQIAYIYRKQLEEAEIIVINKCESVEKTILKRLRDELRKRHPTAEIFEISAREGRGLDPWFKRILGSEQPSRPALELDYEMYAEAGGILGWLNCSANLSSRKYFDGGQVLATIATSIQESLRDEGAEIVHLKMALNPDEDGDGIATLNLIGNDSIPGVSRELPEPIESGELMVNLRAEADPQLLNSVVNRALVEAVEKTPTLFARLEHSEHFRPGKPSPTHRFQETRRT